MPVSLLGLMAIAMFYLATIVIGLCANRCLAREDEDDEHRHHTDEGDPSIKREYSAEVELLNLLESNAVPTGATSAITLTTPLGDVQATGDMVLDESTTIADVVSDHHHSPHASAGHLRRMYGDYDRYSPSPVAMASIVHHSSCNSVVHQHEMTPSTPTSRPARPFSSGSIDEVDSYGSLPRSVIGHHHHDRVAVARAMGGANHIRPARKILRKRGRLPSGGKFLLAERNIGFILGSLSLLAIRTGGVYSNSISEQVYTQGLLWCQMPIASAISLILGGCLFANQIYSEGFVTMIDPFQNLYGIRAGIILMIPVLVADILFAAVVLSSLGALLQTTLGFNHSLGVVCSLFSVLAYLMVGGLYAGTFTDAVQFIYLVMGLMLVTPFALTRTHPSLADKVPSWLGEVDARRSGLYIDQMAVLILGGIPMQSYFQRVLSSAAAKNVRVITVASSVGCLLNAVPAVLIGAAAKSADWANTTLGASPAGTNVTIVLPLLVNEFVPSFVLFVALGALASGLMASCDSAIFGSATMITQNMYRNWIRPMASERELRWAARLAILVLSALILLLCLLWPHWHEHWLLPYDILYVLVFPQLFCAVHYRYANTYGAIIALVVGTAFRLSFGETSIHLPAAWRLPFWDPDDGQLFPYRTFAMLISLLTLLFVSLFYHYLHYKGRLTSPNDIFVCFAHESSSKRRKRVTLESVERTTVL